MADVDCRVEGRLGRIHLDRPKALNALTHDMVITVGRTLAAWRDDPQVSAVLITGEGDRAFCAGGDVREVYRLSREEGAAAAARFFYDEYRMNWRIKRFPKPYIAVLDGVTMGGGFGISVHGGYRLATEATVFAMPETAIGMFPDVGGTYVLSRMPGGLGTWLALTGHRLGAADTVVSGIATHFVARERLADLVDALARATDPAAVGAAIAAVTSEAGAGEIAAHRAVLDDVFGRQSLQAIRDAADAEPSGWAAAEWAAVRQRSPTSVVLTFAQLSRGRRLDFDAAMRLEYRIVQRILAGHDFYEGVRALLIDKDQRPNWRPGSLDAVEPAHVETHFAPLAGGDLPLDWH